MLTVFTVLNVLIVETVKTVWSEMTENLKKYDSLTDNLKARDASASKKKKFWELPLLVISQCQCIACVSFSACDGVSRSWIITIRELWKKERSASSEDNLQCNV